MVYSQQSRNQTMTANGLSKTVHGVFSQWKPKCKNIILVYSQVHVYTCVQCVFISTTLHCLIVVTKYNLSTHFGSKKLAYILYVC